MSLPCRDFSPVLTELFQQVHVYHFVLCLIQQYCSFIAFSVSPLTLAEESLLCATA